MNFTAHALQRMRERGIREWEVIYVVRHGTVRYDRLNGNWQYNYTNRYGQTLRVARWQNGDVATTFWVN